MTPKKQHQPDTTGQVHRGCDGMQKIQLQIRQKSQPADVEVDTELHPLKSKSVIFKSASLVS